MPPEYCLLATKTMQSYIFFPKKLAISEKSSTFAAKIRDAFTLGVDWI